VAQITVGIRDLKEQLSRYLDQVKTGATVVITDRGKPIGRIISIAPSLDERLQQLAAANVLAWSGRRVSAEPPAVHNNEAKTVAELLLEDRE
jgi:prevent-host-death family protein